MKSSIKKVEKKLVIDNKKIDLLQLSESIKKVEKKDIEKDSLYIFTQSEIDKANLKLQSFKEKYKSIPIEDLTSKEKRNLKLSKHLSSTRSKIRNQFEENLISFFKAIDQNKLSSIDQNKFAKIHFEDFFISRFSKFKKNEKIYIDLFSNSNNSLNKKIELLCKIYNK